MNTLTNQLSILDIKVRDYLHIKKFRKQKRSIYDEQYLIKNKIPYFWLNASTLITGYIIKTIDGYIQKPVIGIRQLRRMYFLHYDLLKKQLSYMERFRYKCRVNVICSISRITKFPSEIIRYIVKFL